MKTENRMAILRSAYRLFLEKGFENTSNLEIAQAAGLDTRMLYRYFENKADVLRELVEEFESRMLDYIIPVCNSDQLVLMTVFSLMKYEFAVRNPDYFRLRSSLIRYPDAFMGVFISAMTKILPDEEDWHTDHEARVKWFYIFGGMQMVQYEFITDYAHRYHEGGISSFIADYSQTDFSQEAKNDFRTSMDLTMRHTALLLGSPQQEVDGVIEDAHRRLAAVDIDGFRRFAEQRMGL